jgi:hypothetical protein
MGPTCPGANAGLPGGCLRVIQLDDGAEPDMVTMLIGIPPNQHALLVEKAILFDIHDTPNAGD